MILCRKAQEAIYALDDKKDLSQEIDKESGLSLAMLAVRELPD